MPATLGVSISAGFTLGLLLVALKYAYDNYEFRVNIVKKDGDEQLEARGKQLET